MAAQSTNNKRTYGDSQSVSSVSRTKEWLWRKWFADVPSGDWLDRMKELRQPLKMSDAQQKALSGLLVLPQDFYACLRVAHDLRALRTPFYVLSFVERNLGVLDMNVMEKTATAPLLTDVFRMMRDHPRNEWSWRAAREGWLWVVQWAHKYVEVNDVLTVEEAIRNRHRHVLAWIIHRRIPEGQAQYLCRRRYRVDASTFALACRRPWSYMPILRFLSNQNCPLDGRPAREAVRRNNLCLLKWLCASMCPLNGCVEEAIKCNHPHILEWLMTRKENKRFGWFLATLSITYGSLDMLKWTIEHKYPHGRTHLLRHFYRQKVKNHAVLAFLKSL